MASKVVFRKSEGVYCPIRNGKPLKGLIERHYNWYSHNNYYKIKEKTFRTLKEAKEYFVSSVEVEA